MWPTRRLLHFAKLTESPAVEEAAVPPGEVVRTHESFLYQAPFFRAIT
jgi:hypothetical protein